MNQYANIPEELRLLPQWVVCDSSKVPINPKTGYAADTTNPETWSTFDEAVYANYPHIGFVFTRESGYAGIDLDSPENEMQSERHSKIYDMINSYAEKSQSGRGAHLICRGSIPNGVRRDKCEVYSDSRFFIMTGDVLKAMVITDQQKVLDELYLSMSSTNKTDLVETESTLTDEQIMAMATAATNADKFNYLFRGQMNGHPSQSEADFALLAMLCFYSKSNEQVRRIFRKSALGQRDKATKNDTYIDFALEKIRGRQEAEAIPEIDFTELLSRPIVVDETPPIPPLYTSPAIYLPPPPVLYTGGAPSNSTSGLTNPPGLIGEISDYIYSSAIRQVHEVALGAGISLVAGIAGRQYNISDYGLNQYIVLVAETGIGKESGVEGIDRLITAMLPVFPDAQKFLGPASFASGQGLTKTLDKNPCFLSVLNEIGLTFKDICDPRAASHMLNLRKMWLDLYSKSGWKKYLRPTVYSDDEKNTTMVKAPNFSIFGDSAPDIYYNSLGGDHIANGLIPRFITITHTGNRPYKNYQAFHNPPQALLSRLVELAKTVETMFRNNTNLVVPQDLDASILLESFSRFADDKINESKDVTRHLWNRAELKALKLAALVAVGCNHIHPIVTKEIAQWAIDFVMVDVGNMSEKFDGGEAGEGDHKQSSEIKRVIDDYQNLSEKTRLKYKVPANLVKVPKFIPYVFLRQRLFQLAAFKNDRRGAREAIQKCLDEMVKAGILTMVPATQAMSEFQTPSPLYIRGTSY